MATQHRFTASDGLELSYTLWNRDPGTECRTLVLILHGIGFHSEPYLVIAENVHTPETVFAGLDFRGHDRSGGVRGELPPLRRMIQDIAEWVRHLQSSYAEAPTFLIGESMSGPYAVLYASENQQDLDGLILIAPAVLASRRVVYLGCQRWLSSRSSTSIDLTDRKLLDSPLDSGFFSQRLEDPLSLRSVSSGYVFRILLAIVSMLLRRNLTFPFPVLIAHGAKDNILSPLGSRFLQLRLKSPDKQLVFIPDAYHTFLWDSSSPKLLALIDQWIEERVAGSNQ